MKVLVSDPISAKGIDLLRRENELEVDVKIGLSPQELLQVIPEYEALVVRSETKVTASVVEAARKLRVVGRAGIGVDNVDVEAASKRGIIVMNTPGGNTITTAEHAISLLLALARKIPQAYASLQARKWDRKRFVGVEVYRKTLGVIGLGRIGSVVADRAKGLGMEVIAYDPHISPEVAERIGVEFVEFEDVLRRSDFITVHVPLTPETRGLLGAEALARVKTGVRIINCARGGIVDEKALYDAIQSGKVAGAALDVFEKEPPGDNPLLSLEEVICTPHLGASTDEAQEQVGVEIARQIIAYLKRGEIQNAVNVPSVDGELLGKLRPYLQLCEQMGSLTSQLVERGIQEVHVRYSGEVAHMGVKPLTVTLLKGILKPFLGETVNEVNAPVLARERGIKVNETTSSEAEYYTSLVDLTLKTDREERRAAGTVFGRHDPRIVMIDGYHIEATPAGYILVFGNIDTPGVIGKIGTILGSNQINIAGMQLGRKAPNDRAVSFVNVDSEIPPQVLAEIQALPNLLYAKLVKL